VDVSFQTAKVFGPVAGTAETDRALNGGEGGCNECEQSVLPLGMCLGVRPDQTGSCDKEGVPRLKSRRGAEFFGGYTLFGLFEMLGEHISMTNTIEVAICEGHFEGALRVERLRGFNRFWVNTYV
jgi:hypothetical protein